MSEIVFNTAGDGYWSSKQRPVTITDMRVAYIDRTLDSDGFPDFGELRVYFDTRTWAISEHGLIYTDRLFLAELREFLDTHGLPGRNVDYSEQGMQGLNYVSLDVGGEFLRAWGKKFNINWETWV